MKAFVAVIALAAVAFAAEKKGTLEKRGVASGYSGGGGYAYAAPAKSAVYAAPAIGYGAPAYSAGPAFAYGAPAYSAGPAYGPAYGGGGFAGGYAAAGPAPVAVGEAFRSSGPQGYSNQVPAAAIRNVETVGVTKTITPVVTKTTTYNTHSEPALSVGRVEGYTQSAQGPAKVAPVQYNTQYTSYANPTVGVNGPVTYAGPAVSPGVAVAAGPGAAAPVAFAGPGGFGGGFGGYGGGFGGYNGGFGGGYNGGFGGGYNGGFGGGYGGFAGYAAAPAAYAAGPAYSFGGYSGAAYAAPVAYAAPAYSAAPAIVSQQSYAAPAIQVSSSKGGY